MIKRVNLIVSSSEDEEDNDIEMDLSDLDTDKLDQELELKDIEKELESSSKSKSSHEMGRIRAKLHRAQEQKKSHLVSIIDKHTIHPNDRLRKSKYINTQRTLVFGSRGINQRMRHLMNDLKSLLPHSKSEPKFDNKRDLSVIGEICADRNCNNCIFFEARRNTDLYLWIARCPRGPSIKFYVTSVHTMSELRLTGNCLKGSRPILVFDDKFNSQTQYKVMKELLQQVFGTPNAHPLSKPFIDRTMSFMLLDNKIWIRNYQIVYNQQNESTDPVLVEIGPRFVLHPVRIQQGAFSGSTIYQDPHFINPNVQRRAVKTQKRLKSKMYQNKMMTNIIKSQRRQERSEE
eukprot:184136_1